MLSYKLVLYAVAYFSCTSLALPIRREVPQEHSHELIVTSVRASLNLNNPDNITDPVFALLGDAAAQQGAGDITDLACLQQAVADQAFTNAKVTNDIEGMTNALIFRALERNTGSVGLASALCTQTAKNPEVAALTQHQDPASSGAAATNKAIALELATQINSIGGDPLDAIKSGTFAPGDLNDTTGKGNTCDDANDPNGCIFTQNLVVADVTEVEINAAIAGDNSAAAATAAASDAAATASAVDSTPACDTVTTVTVTAAAAATETAAVSSVAASAAAATASTTTGGKLQKSKGAVGGVTARRFIVDA